MQKTPFAVAVVGLSAVLALAGCKKKDELNADSTTPVTSEPAAPAAEQAPASTTSALSVSALSVGNVVAADKSVAPVATLGQQDPIIVSVKTDGSASGVPLSVKLTYQDGQTAGEKAQSLTTSGGAETTNVTFRNTSPWPSGKYKAEVNVDGKTVGSQEFEVR